VLVPGRLAETLCLEREPQARRTSFVRDRLFLLLPTSTRRTLVIDALDQSNSPPRRLGSFVKPGSD
jgi:hypothetical protein